MKRKALFIRLAIMISFIILLTVIIILIPTFNKTGPCLPPDLMYETNDYALFSEIFNGSSFLVPQQSIFEEGFSIGIYHKPKVNENLIREEPFINILGYSIKDTSLTYTAKINLITTEDIQYEYEDNITVNGIEVKINAIKSECYGSQVFFCYKFFANFTYNGVNYLIEQNNLSDTVYGDIGSSGFNDKKQYFINAVNDFLE